MNISTLNLKVNSISFNGSLNIGKTLITDTRSYDIKQEQGQPTAQIQDKPLVQAPSPSDPGSTTGIGG